MAGNYVLPNGVFINKECEHCYYVDKVETQRACIVRSQGANKFYKEQIARLEQQLKARDRKIKCLERQVHDWAYVINCLPPLLRRWALWRYSRRS